MSMREYPVYEPAAFLIDEELAAYINLSLDKKNNNVPEEIENLLKDGSFAAKAKKNELPCGYSECEPFEDKIVKASNFTGNADVIEGDTYQVFDDDNLCYLPGKELKLYEAAYKDKEDMLQHFKESLAEVLDGELPELPKDFDWWEHIVSIVGTVFE